MNWKNKFDHEIELALDVRNRGNQGQARVYARRAAGIALREYYQRCKLTAHSTSAYDLLKEFSEMPGQPEKARLAAEYLILRVDDEFKLPTNIDLVNEAQILAGILLPDPDFE